MFNTRSWFHSNIEADSPTLFDDTYSFTQLIPWVLNHIFTVFIQLCNYNQKITSENFALYLYLSSYYSPRHLWRTDYSFVIDNIEFQQHLQISQQRKVSYWIFSMHRRVDLQPTEVMKWALDFSYYLILKCLPSKHWRAKPCRFNQHTQTHCVWGCVNRVTHLWLR